MDKQLRTHLAKAVTALLVVLIAYIAMLALSAIKNYRYIGSGYGNVITVTGEGEVFAVPDIAEFTFSVVSERDTLDAAQEASAEAMNAIIGYLRGEGIEERDIKTTNYSANPRYEYHDDVAVSSVGGGASGGIEPAFRGGDTRVLVGYEVHQSVSVKVRDTERAGTLITGVGELGATNIYGPSFTIDDEDDLKREARKEAIKNAREKARELANDLDVRLVRVVSFHENEGYYPVYYEERAAFGIGGDSAKVVAPELPVGENSITANVSITYEIR